MIMQAEALSLPYQGSQWNGWSFGVLRPYPSYIGFNFIGHVPKNSCGSFIGERIGQLTAVSHPQDHSVDQAGVSHASPLSCSSARELGSFELAVNLTSKSCSMSRQRRRLRLKSSFSRSSLATSSFSSWPDAPKPV